MCSKVSASFCIIVLLLIFFNLCCATNARPDPAISAIQYATTPIKPHQHLDSESEKGDEVEDSCKGIEEEECLVRRTLAAHIDYIYTQKTKP
ncbi:hypothetical protein PTKIN_Ptkin10aG0119200 [Pterospermum kingtungense]